MTAPTNIDEYHARFHANIKYEGFGMETTMISPCPFCAAPDCQRVRLAYAQHDMEQPAVCTECGRGAKAVFTGDANNHDLEIVQTAGPNPPDWLPPMRRAVS